MSGRMPVLTSVSVMGTPLFFLWLVVVEDFQPIPFRSTLKDGSSLPISISLLFLYVTEKRHLKSDKLIGLSNIWLRNFPTVNTWNLADKLIGWNTLTWLCSNNYAYIGTCKITTICWMIYRTLIIWSYGLPYSPKYE